MENKINKLYLFLIPLLIVGISFGYTTFPLCLTLLVLRIAVTDKTTTGFYLIMYGGLIGGVIRNIYPFIPVYGLLLYLFGIILVRDQLKLFLSKGQKSIFYLIALFITFTFFYFAGPQDTFATTKYGNIIQQGLFTIFGYYLFCNSRNINNSCIIQLMFLSTLLMFSFIIKYYNFAPGNLLDYEWFRKAEYAYLSSNSFEEGTLVSYQHIAMNMLYGYAIYLSSYKINKKTFFLYTLLSSQLILTSGCRQAILGLFLVLFLRFTLYRNSNQPGHNFFKKHVLSIALGFIILLVSYQFLTVLNIEFINATIQEGDIGRITLLAQGIQIFYQNPITGSGLGGFHRITNEVYPHNFFVEILCECGIIGMVIFLSFFISCFKKANISLKYLTNNESYLFLVLAALFVRILVSADFTVSVGLFSAMFATLAITNTNRLNATS